MTFDIIRRVLGDYFGYEVFFVQNVTDIDDKIIKRARQRHLYEKYLKKIESKETSADQVNADVKKGLNVLEKKLLTETDEGKQRMMKETISKIQSLTINESSLIDFAKNSADVLQDVLDSELGKDVEDNSIFSSLPRHFETEYNEDMISLNILPPTVVTRVSEYVPEIVNFIQVIVKNGFAYESNGSVYFDSKKFNSAHKYALLLPEAIGDSAALNEGEGDLFLASSGSEKKDQADFVLWKKSKPGEPKWPSPWGEGRPGWHIECSVMAQAILGEQMDIHSGGIDLRFPHHENEIAQSKAFFNTGDSWVNYFLHSGHLNIEGLKMSKSLKNFITIKEALKRNTQRQLRFAFLLHSWKDTLNYSDKTIVDSISFEKSIIELFLNVKDLIRSSNQSEQFVKWTERELILNQKLHETIQNVDEALCNNIDTKTALVVIRDDLVGAANFYLSGSEINLDILRRVCNYIKRILTMFGAIDESMAEFNIDLKQSSSNQGSNHEEQVMPYLTVLAEFRERMRTIGMNLKDQESKLAIMKACDELRDDVLPNLGVRLEDREGRTRMKLVDRETLMKERQIKKDAEEQKRFEKERKRIENEEKEAKKKIPPEEWVKLEFPRDKFKSFDEKVSCEKIQLHSKPVSNNSLFCNIFRAFQRMIWKGRKSVKDNEVET